MARHGVVKGLLAATVAFMIAPAVASATFPGTAGQIAFVRSGQVYVMNADGSGQTPLGTGAWPRWRPDGQRILFQRGEDTWVMNADGSGQTMLVTAAKDAGWSPDGQSIVFRRLESPDTSFCSALFTANADGTGETRILASDEGPCQKFRPEWSPAGGSIAFADPTSLYTVHPDGSGLSGPLTDGFPGGWSPAGHRLVFSRPGSQFAAGDLFTSDPAGGGVLRLIGTTDVAETDPTWAPDGDRVVFAQASHGLAVADDGGGQITPLTAGANDKQPDWQPLPPLPPPDAGYPRPKGASPMSVSLVPAYRACASPTETHGPPLAFGSCSPQQASDSLTVGTFDANGANANSIGRVFMSTLRGDPATPADEADVVTGVSLSDVRCRIALAECEGGALSDYLGSLQLFATIRVTDRRSGGAERDPATAEDWISFFVPVPCAATPDTTIGSTCATQTTLDAAIPGIVGEGKRAIWELGQIGLRDAGIDDPRVDGGETLAVQGVFVP